MHALAAQRGDTRRRGSSAKLVNGLARPSQDGVGGRHAQQPFSSHGSGRAAAINNL